MYVDETFPLHWFVDVRISSILLTGWFLFPWHSCFASQWITDISTHARHRIYLYLFHSPAPADFSIDMIIDQTGCLAKEVIRTTNKQLTIAVDTQKRDEEEEKEISYIPTQHAAQLPFLLETKVCARRLSAVRPLALGLRLLFRECVSDAEDQELLLGSMMWKTSDCHRHWNTAFLKMRLGIIYSSERKRKARDFRQTFNSTFVWYSSGSNTLSSSICFALF